MLFIGVFERALLKSNKLFDFIFRVRYIVFNRPATPLSFLVNAHFGRVFLFPVGFPSVVLVNSLVCGNHGVCVSGYPVNEKSRYLRNVVRKKEVVIPSRVFLDMVRLHGLQSNSENRRLKIPLKLDLLYPPSRGTTDRASLVGCPTRGPAPGPRSG